MTDALELAEADIRVEVSRSIAFLAPEGEQRFDPASVALVLSSSLVTGFLAAFTLEAGKKLAQDVGKSIGTRVLKTVSDHVKGIFKAKELATDPEVEAAKPEIVSEARKAAGELGKSQLKVTIEAAEDRFSIEVLGTTGRNDRGTRKLVQAVSEAVATRVLRESD